jgi:hypothetical protein
MVQNGTGLIDGNKSVKSDMDMGNHPITLALQGFAHFNDFNFLRW